MTPAVGRRMAVLVVLAALLPACSHTTRAEGPTATLGTAPPAPSTTSTTNPYAVPPVIDAAYVNRVLAGLDGVMGDVTRMVVSTRTISADALARLRAIIADPNRLQRAIDGFQLDIHNDLQNYRSVPGNRRTTVTKLITATPACVFAEVAKDYAAVVVSPSPSNPQWIGLRPSDTTRDPAGYNPTSWQFIYDGFPPDRNQPSNPCAS